MPNTKDEVMTQFREIRAHLHALDDALDQERREIRMKAFKEGRDQSQEETVRRKAIGARRMEIYDALEALGLDTIEALDSTDDLQKLITSIGFIIAELADDLEDLRDLERYAELAEKVSTGLVKVVEKLADVAI